MGDAGQGGDYSCGYTWQQALAFPGAAQVVGPGRAFLQAHAWRRCVPHGPLIEGVGEGGSLKTAVIDRPGRSALDAGEGRDLLPPARWQDALLVLRAP